MQRGDTDTLTLATDGRTLSLTPSIRVICYGGGQLDSDLPGMVDQGATYRLFKQIEGRGSRDITRRGAEVFSHSLSADDTAGIGSSLSPSTLLWGRSAAAKHDRIGGAPLCPIGGSSHPQRTHLHYDPRSDYDGVQRGCPAQGGATSSQCQDQRSANGA